MACHRLIEAALGGPAFSLYGDGSAIRDFTYVGDIAAANLAAADADCAPGTVLNVAGGSSITMRELMDLVGEVAGREPDIAHHASQPGDVARTGGRVDRARGLLGWAPTTSLREGLTAQVAWHRSRRA
jgi:nucleoside-diphosphate-sugar epimerase